MCFAAHAQVESSRSNPCHLSCEHLFRTRHVKADHYEQYSVRTSLIQIYPGARPSARRFVRVHDPDLVMPGNWTAFHFTRNVFIFLSIYHWTCTIAYNITSSPRQFCEYYLMFRIIASTNNGNTNKAGMTSMLYTGPRKALLSS